MQLIRKLSGFGAPMGDLKIVYMTYIRSLCEQSSSVWHSSLTLENEEDLERIQKVAFKIILKNRYTDYQNALNILELQTLKERREELCLKFAQKCLSNPKMKVLFPPNNRTHDMKPRSLEHFQILFANTERLKRSPIIYMQTLLNKETERKINLDKLWK